MSDIFDPTDTDIDPQLQQAAVLLEKFAADAGLDLNSLPESEFNELLLQVTGTHTALDGETNQIKEANMEQQNQLTAQDVHIELMKVASAEGVDIASLPREQYTELFDAMLAEMQEPGFAEKVAAAEAEQELHDTVIQNGSLMADAFLLKLSMAGVVDEERVKEAGAKWDAVKGTLRSAEHKATGALGRKVAPFGEASNQSVGRKVLGVGAAAGAAGVGVGRATKKGREKGHEKEAGDTQFEADVLKVASDFLIANGINPETGEQLEQQTEELPYEEQVKQAAAELLRQNGWIK